MISEIEEQLSRLGVNEASGSSAWFRAEEQKGGNVILVSTDGPCLGGVGDDVHRVLSAQPAPMSHDDLLVRLRCASDVDEEPLGCDEAALQFVLEAIAFAADEEHQERVDIARFDEAGVMSGNLGFVLVDPISGRQFQFALLGSSQ